MRLSQFSETAIVRRTTTVTQLAVLLAVPASTASTKNVRVISCGFRTLVTMH